MITFDHEVDKYVTDLGYARDGQHTLYVEDVCRTCRKLVMKQLLRDAPAELGWTKKSVSGKRDGATRCALFDCDEVATHWVLVEGASPQTVSSGSR